MCLFKVDPHTLVGSFDKAQARNGNAEVRWDG
jgi:hypothetical protein